MNRFRVLAAACTAALLAACSDRQPLSPPAPPPPGPSQPLAAYECRVEVQSRRMSCAEPGAPEGVRAVVVGGQNQFVRLASTSVAHDSTTGIFSANVTVQNLLKQAMGTADGVNADPEGIRVFFHSGPVATLGSGAVSVENPDGVGVFTAADQEFFRYPGILAPDSVTAPRPWRFQLDPTVEAFAFIVFLEVQVQPRVVINEIMARPTAGGEPQGEWFEVYNAGVGPVELQGWTIASGGGDAGHTITGSLVLPANTYAVLGASADSGANGGVPVTYAYSGVSLGNDATDWLALRAPLGWTADSVHWGAAPPPAGVARALVSPDSANTQMSAGSSWSNAVSFYGAAGQRGTPGAYNLRGIRATSISSGFSFTCAADDTGQAWCWGLGSTQLGNGGGSTSSTVMVPVVPVRPFGKVSAAGQFSCAIDTLGRPYCWGSYPVGESSSTPQPLPSPPDGVLTSLWSGYGINARGVAVCGVDAEGRANCWGEVARSVYRGESPPTVGPVSALALGFAHACQLSGGRVYCWGLNNQGQLGDGTTSVETREFPVEALLPAGVAFTAVVARGNTTCALSSGGQFYCWGNNGEGQFGNGTRSFDPHPIPVQVPLPDGVAFTSISLEVHVSTVNACGLTAEGQAYCWGGIRSPRLSPTAVLQPPGLLFSAIAAGGEQTCALEKGTGQPYCWGEGGRTGDGTNIQRLTPVAAGR